ncbi:MAG: Gfo/Idh/MocA family oxidoreductase [Anaerolineae bacterium]|nr:Gfo/Idh/MocA family oxidoreductase [Anaerolineae bacterium]MCB0206395.1 Gfo/Idh/MocA family oxidoreductase [Anaerolineae bacterium]
MNKVRWGLLSTANINRKLIPPIRASQRGELVAVASRSQQSADAYAAEWDIPLAFGSYQAMLDSGEIDAVYIGLPNHLHAEWTIRALEAGINVLCEKPFAITMDEVDAMIAAADRTGKVLTEAFMYRHHPQTKLVGEWVQSGRLGDVTLVRSVFSFSLVGTPEGEDNVRLKPETGGGALWDVGVYPVSFAQYVMGGPPEWVIGDQFTGKSGVDVSLQGQMHYAGQRVAQISASFRNPYQTQVEIIGTAGRLLINDPFRIGVDGKPYFVEFHRPDDTVEVLSVPPKELYLGEVEDMHAAILDGQAPYVTLEETRNHVRTVLALYRSAQTGAPVALAELP